MFVELEGNNFHLQSVNMGDPQGSILGSLEFLLFINDLFSHIESGSVILYVEDTHLHQLRDLVWKAYSAN